MGDASPALGPLYVESVHRYPVKSMQGESVETISFRDGHVVGDRQWAVVDPDTGFTLTAKRHGALLEAHARTADHGDVTLILPESGEHAVGVPGTEKALSDWLGLRVELRRPGEANVLYEPGEDALDSSVEGMALGGPSSHFADAADAHILTRSSLRAAGELHPDGDWDVRRFRPTMLVEGAQAGFAEDAWIGSSLLIGDEVRLEVFMPCLRCVMPTRSQPGLPRDKRVARILKDEHNYCLGVYAAGRADGTIRAGDPVVLA